MSYTVLARKFRSQTFDEVVGQDTVTTTLRNAITQNRVHHGYLFCGTRGVGKTSMARILAKALNCLSADAPTLTPCGTCDSCTAIARGEDVDVVEIDAASNTGVDDVRVLRSNTIYRPARSRFKIYIIDEVHMLSTQAFNALLKTLEEPPSHVKFIFATTEVHKIPATILSRVQHFSFKPIPAGDIVAQLLKICREEGVVAEEPAIKRLARLANGSMRDALSLLDQMLSMTGANITAQVVNELLPPTHDELFSALLDRLAAADPAGALQIADRSLAQGQTLDHWCELFTSQVRDLMVLRVCGPDSDLVDTPDDLRPKLAEQAKRFDAGAFVYMITILEELRRSVRSSGSGRALVEAAIIRMAEAAKFSSIESLLERVSHSAAASPVVGAASAPVPAFAPPAPDAKKNAPPTLSASSMTGGTGLSLTTAVKGVSPVDTVTGGLSHNRVVLPAQGPRDEAAKSTSPRAGPIRVPEPVAPRRPLPEPAGAAPTDSTPIARRTTQADLKAAHAEPLVKAALEVFKGQIVHVHRGDAPKTPATRGPSPPDPAEPMQP